MNNKASQTYQTVKTGFFGRIFNYFNKYRNENKLNKKYYQNWDSIKWYYRIGKLSFILSFYFVGKSIFIDKVLKLKDRESEIKILKDEFKKFIHKNLLISENFNLKESLNDIKNSLSNFFDLDFLLEINAENLQKDKEIDLIFKIYSKIIENASGLTDNNLSIEKFDILEKFKIFKIEKKYDTNNLTEEYKSIIPLAELQYKKFLTGLQIQGKSIFFCNKILFESSNIEEVSFIIGMNIVENLLHSKFCDAFENEIINFFDKINDINYQTFNAKYLEDFKSILDQIKSSKSLQNTLISNPFIQINFPEELEEFTNRVNDINNNNLFKKIELTIDLMYKMGFNLQNFKNYKFDNFHYQIFDIRDPDNLMKIKLIKFLKKKIKDFEDDDKNIYLNEDGNSFVKDIQQSWNDLRKQNI